MDFDGYYRPYVPVAQRRAEAAREMAKLRKKGQTVSPVIIEGRLIASTFWGKSWCENLERYSDYENRLPRGRTYVRNGSVVDLQIEPGLVRATVSGSSLYKIKISIEPVAEAQWKSICKDCAGSIDSLVELLQGRFSQAVMERMCRQGSGLFPAPKQIKLSCSCPDWADMCKHVAAVLYGVGARLDRQPELLFVLRQTNAADLIAKAAAADPTAGGTGKKKPGRILDGGGGGDSLAALFGLDMQPQQAAPAAGPPPAKTAAKKAVKKTAKKTVRKTGKAV